MVRVFLFRAVLCFMVIGPLSSFASADYAAVIELKRYSSLPAADTRFGAALDVDGDRVIAAGSSGLNAVPVEVLERNHGGGDAWRTTARFSAPPASSSFLFGYDVALSGDWAAVGDINGGDGRGTAYLYHREGDGSWNLFKTFTNPATNMFDFGSVALDGETLVIGDYNGGTGAAYVYQRNHGGADNWGMVKALDTTPDMEDSRFGSVIDIHCDLIVVGAPFYQSNTTEYGAAYVFERNEGGPDNWGRVMKMMAPNPDLQSFFGVDVAVHGDTIVCGGSNFSDPGKAYIFQRNQNGPNAWGSVAVLEPDDGFDGDRFGVRVDVFNHHVLVGASYASNGVTEAGAAYLFERNESGAGSWGQTDKLIASDGNLDDWFGRALAINAGQIVVAAELDDDFGASSGSLYIYPNACFNFVESVRVTSPAPQTNGFFGDALDVWVNHAVVGEPGFRSGTSMVGRAHIHERNAGGADQWSAIKSISGSGGPGSTVTEFGRAAAVWDDTAVVGAKRDAPGLTEAGAAFVYERNTGGSDNWGEVRMLLPAEIDDDQNSGMSVAIHCDTIVVGANRADADGGSTINAGMAFVYERNTGGSNNWGQAATLEADDAGVLDFFGDSVAVWGDLIAVGATGKDIGVLTNAGAVYIFARNEGGINNWGQTAKITASDPGDKDQFGDAVALYQDTLVVGAPGFAGNHDTAYVFTRSGPAGEWVETSQLQPNDSFGSNADFGKTVDVWEDLIAVGRKNAASPGYLFERNEGGTDRWGLADRFIPAPVGTRSGYAVSLHGRRMLVGNRAEAAPGAGNLAGAFYVLEPGCLMVNTTADGFVNTNDAFLSLREAVTLANADARNDCILLGPETYTISVALGENNNTGGDFDISTNGTLTIKGRGAGLTRVSGGGIDRVFHVLPGANVTFKDLSIINGMARTPISNGDPGGGLYNQGTTYLYRVMVTNNLGSAGNLGGDPGSGGGIASVDSLYIYDSTIANNRTREGSNTVSLVGKSGGAGGGIFATGLLLEMFNSTVSGNETGRGGDDTGSGTGGNGGSGGGLYSSAVTTRLDHCTFGLNVTGDGGSGFIAGNGGFGGGAYLVNAASATHTIFSQNTIGTNAFAAAVRGTINPASYVMVDDLTLATLTGTGNTNASALLEPLGDNGGPTLTHALASGSPALDGGDPAFVFSGLRDQRGSLREPNAVIDIGAVEMTDDFDGDTIPDDWEKANGMNAEDSGDATIDIDLDTFTSFEEYIANTDPFDFYDQLEMLAIFTNVGPIAVRYDSKLGRSYLFDQSFDGGKTWINFGTFPGAGGVQTIGVPDSGTSMIRVRAFIP